MFGFKIFAGALLALAVVATDPSCAPATTVTVTVTQCVSLPGPAPTQPMPYAPLPPPAESGLASDVGNSVTSELVTSAAKPLEPVPTSGAAAPSGPVLSSGEPASAPAAPGTTAPVSMPSGSPIASPTSIVEVPSSAGSPDEPAESATPSLSFNGAPIATPLAGMGSLVAMGAVALVAAVI